MDEDIGSHVLDQTDARGNRILGRGLSQTQRLGPDAVDGLVMLSKDTEPAVRTQAVNQSAATVRGTSSSDTVPRSARAVRADPSGSPMLAI